MQRQQQKYAAIYLRLSRDDGSDSESNSIQNQREMLKKYCEQQGFPIYSEYVDDGATGTNFDRDGFKQMIIDMEENKIQIIVCKDLSRLGRNNALVAYYTEIVFQEYGIRFICINDGIDSEKGENEIMGFRSVINEFYARDISKKIHSAKVVLQQQGKRTSGRPPIGYMVDPSDKHHYVINPETAPLVRRIFQMSADGLSPYLIAKELTLEKTPSPLDIQNGTYTGIEWKNTNVHKMLQNEVYIGSMVYNKMIKPSFKSKKQILTKPSEWIIVPNMHEPLINLDLWELVQKRLVVKKRRNFYALENIFVGIAKCYDCGSNLSLARNANKPLYFRCRKYANYSKEKKCSLHYTNYEHLYNLVLNAIRRNITIVESNQHRMEKFIRDAMTKTNSQNSKNENALLAKLTRRKEELDRIIERLFEESVLGDMPRERFYEMSAKYESERNELIPRIDKINATLAEKTDAELKYRRFFEMMMKYKGAESLSATMLNELIERIDVHENTGGERAKRQQQVDIHYRFIDEGLISSPEN
jgi:DNA invertase Pin-like site-specific DNA recombinase